MKLCFLESEWDKIVPLKKLVADDDNPREELQCIYIEDQLATATDSCHLASLPVQFEVEGEFEPFLLPANQVKKMKGIVILDIAEDAITIENRDNKTSFKRVFGQYPPYKNIVPSPDSEVETKIILNAKYLANLAKATDFYAGLAVELTIYKDQNIVKVNDYGLIAKMISR
jgi:hypothetical protein